MPPASRVGDKAFNPADVHGCPLCPHPVQGPGVKGSNNILINGMQAMRVGDPGMHMACCASNSWKVNSGSSTVVFNNIKVARLGDRTKHCGGSGALIQGSANVIIGG